MYKNLFLFYLFRFRNGFRSVFRFCPCVEWSPEYPAEGLIHRRSLSEPTALSVVYSSQRRSRTTLAQVNSSQPSTTTAESSVNLNRHHR